MEMLGNNGPNKMKNSWWLNKLCPFCKCEVMTKTKTKIKIKNKITSNIPIIGGSNLTSQGHNVQRIDKSHERS